MPTPIQTQLDRSRRELLDLSTRNRLLSIPTQSKTARLIHVQDELTEHVIRLLVEEKKSLSFLPGRNLEKVGAVPGEVAPEMEEEVELPQPDEELDEATGVAKRHGDSRLQTALTSEGLQKRLLNLYTEAQMMIEEQGVNILYLACGHLKWFEAGSDVPRFAPLILIPVELKRKSASERFQLCWREEDLQENLSLGAKLKAEFGIHLPELIFSEEFRPQDYLEAVSRAVAGAEGWEVIPNAMTLGFFSFAKFLMYRDLDASCWPTPELLSEHPLLKSILQEGFSDSGPLLSENIHLDEMLSVDQLDHVVDADSSQSLAIEMVRQGRSLVIQGPPGTGKSQSITNIIATAVLAGKKVLFVAEKLAALEVVKRRLTREGLGDLCLELHSNKMNKRAVIEEIGRTWKLGKPRDLDLEKLVPKLSELRERLNQHARELHEKLAPSQLSFFEILGQLTKLGSQSSEALCFELPEAKEWSPEDLEKRRSLIQDLARRVQAMGLPAAHPWRGSKREAILKIDLEPMAQKIRVLKSALSESLQTTKKLSESIQGVMPVNFLDVQKIIGAGEYIGSAPVLDKQAISHSVWDTRLREIRDLRDQGLRFSDAFDKVGSQVMETAWDKDFSESRMQLAAKGRSLFRFLSGKYRKSLNELKGVFRGEFPKRFEERLELADQLVSGHQVLRSIRAADEMGGEAFGNIWHQEKTDWQQVSRILEWVETQPQGEESARLRQTISQIQNQNEVLELAQSLQKHLAQAKNQFDQLQKELSLDLSQAFGVSQNEEINLMLLKERCQLWLESLEKLSEWIAYFAVASEAERLSLSPLLSRLAQGEIAAEKLNEVFERSYFTQMLREFSKLKPELARFDGLAHHQLVLEFQELDRQRLALAKLRVLQKTHAQLPPLHSNLGTSGIVRSEMERKRGHRSVRRLLKDAGEVVQAIKPVFMMSPLSVAQFLEPGGLEFDLLVIDEASQVEPVDAFGAMARCRQIVVVGDSRQLPPTRFFASMTSEELEENEDEAASAADIESILGLCIARGLPQSMLRWHYRSRHQSLIAVSNHEFYENRLFIVPSPYSAAANFGLKFNHIPEGVFDRGGSSTNLVEAQAIARAVLEHARKTPELSLGVGAFSIKQRQAIMDELELLRRENPDTEPFFSRNSAEPFFVKNLENIQGDERDVIFISVGYGRNAEGYMAMSFGPLSQEGGERRLNVLISRAKRRCEVFSSITAEDIDLTRAKGRGVQAFKTFLTFAQHGRLDTAQSSERKKDLSFEESVRRAVESLGYEVHTQVGIAGFFIDMAIVDPEKKGRYLLGIECDGPSYQAARSARDRDRLRPAVLEDHGWIIHRLWSTDWFQRPEEQLRQVAKAVEYAKSVLAEENSVELKPELILESEDSLAREAALTLDTVSSLDDFAVPYSEAKFSVPQEVAIHDLPVKHIGEILLQIIQHEGPIHEEELLARVRTLWGLQRAGNRIQDAVARGLRLLLVSKQCVREDNCLYIPGASIVVRNREKVQSAGLRKTENLPPLEIREAILHLVKSHHGVARREIPTALARLLGFKSTSAQLSEKILIQIDRLIEKKELQEEEGLLQKVD